MMPPLLRDLDALSSAEPGTVLSRRGKPPESVCWIKEGRVVIGLAARGGPSLAHRLGTVEGPSWLEVGSAVLGVAPAVDALAETSVTLARVPLGVFRRWLDTMPRPLRPLLHDMALAQQRQTAMAVSRISKDAQGRLAEWLLDLAQPASDQATAGSTARLEPSAPRFVRLDQHKRQIAAQLGIAPETFSRVLRDFREKRYIAGRGRVMTLIDVESLRELAGA